MALSKNLNLVSIAGSDLVDPKPIDDNFTLLDAVGLDYIVENGSSGVWTYRKWKSGVLEMWAKIEFPTTTASGPIASGFSFPFPFAAEPVVTLAAGVSGRIDAYVNYCHASATAVDCYINKSGSDNLSRWVYCYAKGSSK